MEVTYGQLETILLTHFRIQPDRAPTFRSRIKQLQRMQFPPGVNVGRGAKMGYSGEHLFMLVSAFELMSCGHPALTACTLIARHWEEFSAAYSLAALQARRFDEQHPQTLAVLWVESMWEIQFHRGWGEPEPSKVKVCDEAVAARELRFNKRDRHDTRLIISVGKILQSVLDAATNNAGARANCWDEEFHSWLPKGSQLWVDYRGEYPDRSNLELRSALHQRYGNDPNALTPDGAEEAREFLENDYSSGIPF